MKSTKAINLRPTSVLQKWGISTKFEHWNSIKLDY
jgi:hypothetical protein